MIFSQLFCLRKVFVGKKVSHILDLSINDDTGVDRNQSAVAVRAVRAFCKLYFMKMSYFISSRIARTRA